MWPLCSSTLATPLKIMTTARLSVHTLTGSKEVFRTKTLPFIWGDITRAFERVSKICGYKGSTNGKTVSRKGAKAWRKAQRKMLVSLCGFAARLCAFA